ncbi:DUF309 domain-containing protein [Candidatus Cyanaurora vandensis]|uniref:DUF309 domain-containing protein n=1 Tax=Candidatus Cyanaurora vandensis TaxID=2714958 RepID=UPI00257D36E4|nr:DUF309 domain-containing protein [Candidatus Cyanaurora vandensis]
MVPAQFWQGLDQFNHRDYYACHDTLEALWMESGQPLRLFYQGILQLAVAYYHLENQNWAGAVTLLGQGIERLDYFLPEYLGVDVAGLVQASGEVLDALHELPDQDLSQFQFVPPQIYYQQEQL